MNVIGAHWSFYHWQDFDFFGKQNSENDLIVILDILFLFELLVPSLLLLSLHFGRCDFRLSQVHIDLGNLWRMIKI